MEFDEKDKILKAVLRKKSEERSISSSESNFQ